MRCRNIAYATRPKWMRGMQLGLSCQEEVAVSLPRIWHSLRLLTVYEPITDRGWAKGSGGEGREGGTRDLQCLSINQLRCPTFHDSPPLLFPPLQIRPRRGRSCRRCSTRRGPTRRSAVRRCGRRWTRSACTRSSGSVAAARTRQVMYLKSLTL